MEATAFKLKRPHITNGRSHVPLALFRVSAQMGNKPKGVRVDAEGNKRQPEEIDFIVVDGQFREMK